ncbi:lipoprotein-releasing ABC transporter permease subunit [Alteromonas sp. ASW11-19]|uniref:Lipoprotein-releasing ABC transporter permease subunit n=1 Tax=Alteromonas salexigens TaxID=2982530 RepID=A0ABT2VKS8_9ALTE|nr:lipoprotein-releasing ABC transporter permease subunit [Alteromonas salexigens]MCU7553902.1 lipoprotein-releasing ABC transporter permease subunit [Alteromonas salexigens]
MFQPVAAFVALRYATGGKHNSFVAFINKFSVAGIALGLMALIVVLSVMNGFESQLKDRVLGIVPQVVTAEPVPADALTQLNGVRAAMAFRETEGVVQSRQGLRGVQLHGIEPEVMHTHSIVSEHLLTGRFSHLQPGSFNVILGRALATQLDIQPGDRVRVMLAGASIYTPFGRMPSQRLVTVAGIYDAGSQMDSKVIFMHLEDVGRLLRLPAANQAPTRLFLHDAFNYQQVVTQLQQRNIASENWRSRQGPLFDAVKMEKNMMFMMLLLIIAVAAFNIVSALVMVVSEKHGDIAILQTQGMTGTRLMMVFMLNGLFNGVKGAGIGLVTGLLLAFNLNGLLALVGIQLALSADGGGVPVAVNAAQVVWVTVFSLALCVLASLYPASRALRVNPARALQNE